MASGYDDCYDASWHLFPPDYVEDEYRILESIKMPRTGFHIHDILQLDSKPSQEETEVQVLRAHDGHVAARYIREPEQRHPSTAATWAARMADWTNVTNHAASASGGSECAAAAGLDQPHDLGPVVPAEAGDEPRVQGGGVAGLRGRAADERVAATRDGAQETEEAGVVLQGANVRARETFPPAEIPKRARAGAPGLDHPTDAHAGEDLVPEPQIQDEEGSH